MYFVIVYLLSTNEVPMSRGFMKEAERIKAGQPIETVHLHLPFGWRGRLRRCAEKKGLKMSVYARMMIMEQINKDEFTEANRNGI